MKRILSKDVKVGGYYLIYKRIAKDEPAHGKLMSIVRKCPNRSWESVGTLRTFGKRDGKYYHTMSLKTINRLEESVIELLEEDTDVYWDECFCYRIKDIFELNEDEILMNGNVL